MTAAGPAARIGFMGCPRKPRLSPGPRGQHRELRACPNNLPETRSLARDTLGLRGSRGRTRPSFRWGPSGEIRARYLPPSPDAQTVVLMELWLLGGGAVVLIALTLWIVWPAEYVETTGDDFRNEEDLLMTPQGDEFEDQYTSATADLSAGGVATAIDAMQEEAEAPPEPTTNAEPTPYGAAGESWSSPTIAREGATDVAVTPSPSPQPALP